MVTKEGIIAIQEDAGNRDLTAVTASATSAEQKDMETEGKVRSSSKYARTGGGKRQTRGNGRGAGKEQGSYLSYLVVIIQC